MQSHSLACKMLCDYSPTKIRLSPAKVTMGGSFPRFVDHQHRVFFLPLRSNSVIPEDECTPTSAVKGEMVAL